MHRRMLLSALIVLGLVATIVLSRSRLAQDAASREQAVTGAARQSIQDATETASAAPAHRVRTADLRGLVVAAGKAAPLCGIAVRVGPDSSTVTDAHGRFTIHDLGEGETVCTSIKNFGNSG